MKTTLAHPAYEPMKKASRRVLKSFRTDLTKHDRAALAKRGHRIPFLWALWDCGTYLCFVTDDKPIDRKGRMPHHVPEMVQGMGSVGYRGADSGSVELYGWDGVSLRKFESVKAAEEWCIEQERPADFQVSFGGIVTIIPLRPAVRSWIETNTHVESWQWLGGALAIDQRCAETIVEALRDEGFKQAAA